MKVSMQSTATLLVFFPLICVSLGVLQNATFRFYVRWRRRASQRALAADFENLAWNAPAMNGDAERLACMAAILPGHSTAMFVESEADQSLRAIHYGRRAAPIEADHRRHSREILEHKNELHEWTRALRSSDLSSGIVRDMFAPSSVRRFVWPWRSLRSSMYLVRVERSSDATLWAAGFFDEQTYVPPGHVFEDRLRKYFSASRDGSEQRARQPARNAGPDQFAVIANAGPDDPRDANLSRMIHDVRLPLARLFAMLENLQDRTKLRGPDDELDRSFARIARQLRTMESFTYDILNLETGGNAELDKNTARFGFAERILPIVDAHLDLIQRKRITVVRNFPEPDPIIQANQIALDRILFNLLTNSFQFCSSPGTIYLSIETRPRHVLLDIEDSGPGLVSQENTFELSRRNIGRGGSGWGIGLASAGDLSRRLGGRLVPARPRHGKGARFLLVLPGIPGQTGYR